MLLCFLRALKEVCGWLISMIFLLFYVKWCCHLPNEKEWSCKRQWVCLFLLCLGFVLKVTKQMHELRCQVYRLSSMLLLTVVYLKPSNIHANTKLLKSKFLHGLAHETNKGSRLFFSRQDSVPQNVVNTRCCKCFRVVDNTGFHAVMDLTIYFRLSLWVILPLNYQVLKHLNGHRD